MGWKRKEKTDGSTTKPLTIAGLEESRRFLIESRQGPVHGINNALGNTSASRGWGDAADHGDLLDSLVRSGRRAEGGRFGVDQLGGTDGLDG